MTFVLFLNAPVGLLEFTVDGVTAQCDKKFEGFKSVPTGIHFFSYRYSRGSDTGPSTCLILDCTLPAPVLVFSWDRSTEQFSLIDSQPFVTEAVLKYSHLAAYSSFMGQEGCRKWHAWTGNLTSRLLERCLSSCKIPSIIPIYEVTPMHESHHSLLQNHQSSPLPSVMLSITRVPTLKQFSATASPEQVTKAACDRSIILESMNVSFGDLLGELEFSFLLLVIGHNFEGFQQWIDLLGLLSGSIRYAQGHPAEYSKLFSLLKIQFEFCPEDFFNGLLTDNKLFMMLGGLVSAMQQLTTEVKEFCDFFESKFGIDLDGFNLDEYGEYAPSVVDLDDQ